MTCRSFLLLQGVASPFFSELQKALNLAGHQSLKINFCGGDLFAGRFFSTALKHENFRGELTELPDFYHHIFKQHNITDIVLFGDTRPVNSPAIQLAKEKDLTIHVFEEGYLRPNWVTLEYGGVNAHSSLSKDPNWYLDFYKHHLLEPQQSESTGGGLLIRGWHDIRYHLAKTLLKPYFPHYRSHRPDSALKEYWGFLRRIPAVSFYYHRKSEKIINDVINSNKTFYLLPLQLGADSQIRIHSKLESITDYIQVCMKSFANNAPKNSLLVIKNHPLDPWFIDYPNVIKKAAKKYSIDNNSLIFLEAGDLARLLKNAKGTVLINSTVGTSSLSYGCPVIALGDAIYNMKGLTFQGELDDFWTQATPPDQTLFKAFHALVIDKTQINGSFYNQKGISMAVKNCFSKLTSEAVAAPLTLESHDLISDAR